MSGRRSIAAGVVVSLASAAAPVVLGSGADPAEISLLDGAAWLGSSAAGNIVRVNGETGRVDARIDLGAVADDLLVDQSESAVLVNANGRVRSVDVANLRWGAEIDADGELIVGDDTAYMVTPDGVVRELDPATLESRGRVELDASPGRGVVAKGRLVLPLDDGTVAVVDGDEVVAEVDAGGDGDLVHVSRVGDRVAVLNAAEGTLRRLDAASGDVSGARDVDLPDGELAVPRELPDGALWLLGVRSGELVGLDTQTGEARRAPIAEGGHDLTEPAVVGDRVYVVDRTAATILEIDAASLAVLQPVALGLPNASKVELIAHGGKVFVNDRGGNMAIVIDGDQYRRVDKATDEGVAIDTPPAELPESAPAPSPAPSPGAPNPAPAPGPAPGPPAAPAPTVPPVPVAPSAPTGVTATAGNESATVAWSPGGGGGAVSAYRITYPGAARPVEAPGAQRSIEVTGLTNGDEYTFEVWAVNEVGESQRVTSNQVRPNDEVPGAPSDVEATSDVSQGATVTWSEADARGNEIANYIVTQTPGELQTEVPGDRTEATIEGLTNDTSYTFTVTAVNDLGIASDPSDPSPEVTPYGPPGAIPAVRAAEGPGTVGLEWDPAPSSLPVDYRISATPTTGADPVPSTSGVTNWAFESLDNGTVYQFTITPFNDRGDGPPIVASGRPGTQPTISNVAAERTGDRTFRVTFDVDNGGRPIDTCTIAGGGNGAVNCSVTGGNGSGTVEVATFNTGYTFTPTVASTLGSSSGGQSVNGTSAGKPLVVDADPVRWDGATCTWQGHENTRPYYAEANHTCTSEAGYIGNGTTVRALCWSPGGQIRDDNLTTSSTWIRIDRGYMNTLYFTTWANNPESNLPRC